MDQTTTTDPVADFIDAACVPLDAAHVSGTLERAEAIRAAHPEVASADIYTAAILGDDAAVQRFIRSDPESATAQGGPRAWDALTYLCFSRYLRLDTSRWDDFTRAARALLDAGANPNGGWFEPSHQPHPQWESVLYGAAGVAHHPELTRLLLERGANPNDEEVVYHTPETYDNRALKLLVETGKLSDESLSLMLIRKHDWHDYDGVKWLLEHGADANRNRWRGFMAIHHAIARDNDLRIIELLLDYGADPMSESHGMSAVARAARRGRADVLQSIEQRRIPFELHGVERLIAACARSDERAVAAIAEREPRLVDELRRGGGQLLAEFAGNGNTDGVRRLLDLGVAVDTLFESGDGYWGIAPRSTALHVASWRAQHDTVKALVALGAAVNARDDGGRTPLMLAVSACVDSYWTHRRSPGSVAALIAAGASTEKVKYPSGYADVDELIRRARERS